MAMTKALDTSTPESVELAFDAADEVGMLHALVKKYARVLDMTDSGRDIKPLVTGMLEAYDRYSAAVAASGSTEGVPLYDILRSVEDDQPS